MKNKPILVLGCQRSGTTLLNLILDSHPQIHGFDETVLFPMDKIVAKVKSGEINLNDVKEKDLPTQFLPSSQASSTLYRYSCRK